MAAISAMVSRLPKAMEQLILREDSFQNTDKRDSSGSTMGNRGLGTILCSEVFSHLSPCERESCIVVVVVVVVDPRCDEEPLIYFTLICHMQRMALNCTHLFYA